MTGRVLRLLVRVPLEAMRDVDFPLRDDGSLDLVARAGTAARRGADLACEQPFDHAQTAGRSRAPRIVGGARRPAERPVICGVRACTRAAFCVRRSSAEVIPWQQVLFDVALEYDLPAADAQLVLAP